MPEQYMRYLADLIEEGSARTTQIRGKFSMRKSQDDDEPYGTCALGAAVLAAGYYRPGHGGIPDAWRRAPGFDWQISQQIMTRNDREGQTREEIAAWLRASKKRNVKVPVKLIPAEEVIDLSTPVKEESDEAVRVRNHSE